MLKAQVGEGRELDLREETLPLHIILASSWGDVRVTLLFRIGLGQSGGDHSRRTDTVEEARY